MYYRNFVYRGVTSWESFEPALTAAEEMDLQAIWECAAPIPSEWCGPNADALPKLVEALYRRRSKIRDLITAFRNSSREPFPDWTDNRFPLGVRKHKKPGRGLKRKPQTIQDLPTVHQGLMDIAPSKDHQHAGRVLLPG